MTASSLDSALRATIRRDSGDVRVVARGSTPVPRSGMELASTPALMAWNVVTRLSLAERLSWLAWVWCVVVALTFADRRRSGDDRPPLPNGGASSAGRGRRFPGRARTVALRGR